MSETTLGCRLKNPLCVKQPGSQRWKGSTGTDSKGHAIFSLPEWGIRAGVRILAKYAEQGCKSLNQITEKWAPSTDNVGSIPGNVSNDPKHYAVVVAKQVGVGVNNDLEMFSGGNVTDEDKLIAVIKAMAIYESKWMLDEQIIKEGINLYEKDFAEKETIQIEAVDGPLMQQTIDNLETLQASIEALENACKDVWHSINGLIEDLKGECNE